MCLGGGPSAPQVVYQGPSDDDIRRSEQQLQTYQQQMSEQQARFESQLQDQISQAQLDTAELQSKLAAETAAASAASAAETAAAYSTSATQTEAPQGAVTTEPVKKKKKAESTLRISREGAAQAAGTGLNIGV